MSRRELLHDHLLALGQGGLKGGHDLLAGGEVGCHAPALVAVTRLDDHRHTDIAGSRPGVVGIARRTALGHRHADGLQERPRQLFILGDRFGNGAGAISLRGLDATELRAVAELHHALRVQPPHGNAAGLRRVNNRTGAGSKAGLMGEVAEALDLALDVIGPIVDRRQDEFPRRVQACQRQLFIVVLDDHAIDARLRGFTGTSETDFPAGQRLQFQRDVLENMPRVGPVPQPLKKTAACTDAAAVLDHAGQPACQAIAEPGEVGGGAVEIVQLHPGFNHGCVGPNVRTTQGQHFTKFHGSFSRQGK